MIPAIKFVFTGKINFGQNRLSDIPWIAAQSGYNILEQLKEKDYSGAKNSARHLIKETISFSPDFIEKNDLKRFREYIN